MKPREIAKIIVRNTFTLFNLVNLVLALMVAFVGSYKNMLFILIALANTAISIINEIRAAAIINKLKLLSTQRPTVLKNGRPTQVPPESVTKNDILILSLGDQIQFDCELKSGYLEVNEAFITGEQDPIEKRPGDPLHAGSFVISGAAEAKVLAPVSESSLAKLEQAAHTVKTADSELFTLLNKIVKYISYALIPIGALLLWARFRTEPDTTTAVTSTVAALINMIPEGLILLTSSVLALATVRLARRNVLVQDLYSIETLARVDTICLDKTGTLTTGNMTVHDFVLPDGTTFENLKTANTPAEKSFLTPLASILSHQMSENATTTALKKKLARGPKFREIDGITEVIPFSSDRKHSGLKTKTATYLLGAIEFITDDPALIEQVKSHMDGYRVLALVKHDLTDGAGGAREGDTLLGMVRLEDELRPAAPEIINYFYENNVAPKIISGDDLETVTEIAKTVGIQDLRAIDLSTTKSPNYAKLVKDYTIFTRVTPPQKKSLVAALKKQGRTVAMTGDGVNDILAMKEADCSIAIGDGSDAARRAARIVLLNSDFSAVPNIIAEGRQTINNLERSTSLFLTKTVYASLLAVLFVFLPLSYPFSPIEMSLLNFACIGFPGLALALEKNTARIKNQFLNNILTYSVPTGLTVVIAMLALSTAAEVINLPRPELTTIATFTTFAIGLILIYQISRPLNLLRASLLALLILILIVSFLLPPAKNFFEFAPLSTPSLILALIIIAASILIFALLRRLASRLAPKFLSRRRI